MSEMALWHSLGGHAGTVLQQIIEKYNDSHDCKVNLTSILQQGYEKAVTEALNKPRAERPNLILAPEFMTGRLKLVATITDDIVPIEQVVEQEILEDIPEIVQKTFGKYALPMNPACGVLYINRDALSELGKAADWVPQTFEELKEVSKELVEKGIVDYGFTCAWPESYLIETPLAQQDKPLVLPDNGLHGSGVYNLSQMKEHILELWRQTKEKVFLPPNTGNYDPTRIPFVSKQVAFFMQGSGHYTLLDHETKDIFKLECAALPTLTLGQETKHAFPLGGAALWVLNTEEVSEEKKAYALDAGHVKNLAQGVRSFLNYLTSTEIQVQWHTETAYVPVRKSVANQLEEEGFYKVHLLHKAVVDQTLRAPLGNHSFGIKTANYRDARSEMYPLIRELIHLEGTEEEVAVFIEERLATYDAKWSPQS